MRDVFTNISNKFTNEELYKLYVTDNVSTESIALSCGVSRSTIQRYLRINDIKIPKSTLNKIKTDAMVNFVKTNLSGKTWDEAIGVEASKLRSKLQSESRKELFKTDVNFANRIVNHMQNLGELRKGKTEIEMYGIDKAKSMQTRRNTGVSKTLSSFYLENYSSLKGKTFEEISGVENAKIRRKICRDTMINTMDTGKLKYARVSIFHKRMFDRVKLVYSDAIIEHRVDNKFVDIFIPSISLAIECDGYYYHENTSNVSRDLVICREGIKVIHYCSYIPMLSEIKNDIDSILKSDIKFVYKCGGRIFTLEAMQNEFSIKGGKN